MIILKRYNHILKKKIQKSHLSAQTIHMCNPIQINLPDCLDLSKKCHTVFIGTSCATLCGDMDIIECEFRSVCGDTANCNICKCRTFTPSNSPSKYPSEFPSK
eukprot:290867_1